MKEKIMMQTRNSALGPQVDLEAERGRSQKPCPMRPYSREVEKEMVK